MKTYNSGVYTITDVRTLKTYVGSSRYVEHRISQQRSDLRGLRHNNTAMQEVWDEPNFEFKIVIICEEGSRLMYEQLVMDLYKQNTFNRHPTAGSSRGFIVSDTTKSKMRESAKSWASTPENKAKVSAQHKGRVVSQLTRGRQSEYMKQQMSTPEGRGKFMAGLYKYWGKKP